MGEGGLASCGGSRTCQSIQPNLQKPSPVKCATTEVKKKKDRSYYAGREVRNIGNGQQNIVVQIGGLECVCKAGGRGVWHGGMLGGSAVGGGPNCISRRRVARGMPWRYADRRP